MFTHSESRALVALEVVDWHLAAAAADAAIAHCEALTRAIVQNILSSIRTAVRLTTSDTTLASVGDCRWPLG
jgi:hypothetical protein